jgi:large conductance mechanosensitive channel
MHREFMNFIREYGIVGLAIAVIIGGKLNAFVSSLVDGLLMPIVLFFIPGGNWRTATLDLGPFHLLPGPIFGALVDFVIVALIVFLIAKFIMKEEKVTKK